MLGSLAGIGNDNKRELSTFDLNTAEMSAFDVANSLWDMIEQNQQSEGDIAALA